MIFRITLILAIIGLFFGLVTADQRYDFTQLVPQQGRDGKWGYIDNEGSFKIKPQFELAFPFQEGLAAVSVSKKYGFINTRGKLAIRLQFDDARSFFEDVAAVMISQGGNRNKWGYIDKSGKFIIKAKYDSVSDFFNVTADVTIGDKNYTIDKSGEIIYALQL